MKESTRKRGAKHARVKASGPLAHPPEQQRKLRRLSSRDRVLAALDERYAYAARRKTGAKKA